MKTRKQSFNKYFSKPLGMLLLAVVVFTLCAAESMVDNGMWLCAALGVFAPIVIMSVLYRKGYMEWMDKPFEDCFE